MLDFLYENFVKKKGSLNEMTSLYSSVARPEKKCSVFLCFLWESKIGGLRDGPTRDEDETTHGGIEVRV